MVIIYFMQFRIEAIRFQFISQRFIFQEISLEVLIKDLICRTIKIKYGIFPGNTFFCIN